MHAICYTLRLGLIYSVSPSDFLEGRAVMYLSTLRWC